MKSISRGNKKTWKQIILACALLAMILFSFYDFAHDNHERIIEQNEIYTKDVTRQTTDRVDDMLKTRQYALNVITVTVENSLTNPSVSQDTLAMLQRKSAFDYLEFVDANGLNHRSDGQTSNSVDRENYIEGMKGNSGITLIFNSRITHETLVNYYTPISYEGEIIGVLNGMYREERLRQTISTDFFGMPARTYLCKKDGTVISVSHDKNPPQNILEILSNHNGVSQADVEQIFPA